MAQVDLCVAGRSVLRVLCVVVALHALTPVVVAESVQAPDRLRGVASKGCAECAVIPSTQNVLLETAGPRAEVLVLGQDLRPVGRRANGWRLLATDQEGKRILGVAFRRELNLLTVPSLDVVQTTAAKPPWSMNYPRGLHHLGPGEGWVATMLRGPNVVRIRENPLRYEAPRASTLKAVVRTALDATTSVLALIGDSNKLELFDVKSMRTTRVLDLPCEEVTRSLFAHEGQVWVGTTHGKLFRYDVAKGVLQVVLRGAQHDEVLVSGCPKRSLLAVMWVRGRQPLPYPCEMRVFRLDGPKARQVSAVQKCSLPFAVNDLALRSEAGDVLIADHAGVLVWRFKTETESPRGGPCRTNAGGSASARGR